jgi:hypothetical protein
MTARNVPELQIAVQSRLEEPNISRYSVKNGVRARLEDTNRDLRVRPDSDGLTPEMRRKNLKSDKNIDGLPIGDAPPRTCRQCKPINQRTKAPPKPRNEGSTKISSHCRKHLKIVTEPLTA